MPRTTFYLQIRILFVVLLASATSFAQSYQGGLRGTVTDPQGAALSKVTVTLTDQATKLTRTAVSNGGGEYVFTAVEPATYTLIVTQSGFQKYEQKDVVIAPQQFQTIDMKLVLGSASETVEVAAVSPLLDATTASNGQNIDMQKLEDLPNLGRNPFLMAKLSNNVAAVGDPRFNRFQDQSGSSQISIAGGPVRTNNYLVDGVPITDLNNRAVIIPSLEATEEMKLQANTYDAEIARTGGGTFNTVLKSGSSRFHGTLYGETRQTNWAARPYFYTPGAPLSATFYSYAGAIGGPVVLPKILKKDSTFFWITEEGYRQRSPLSGKYYVPTTAERGGDFSGDIGTGSADGVNCLSGATCLKDPLYNTVAGTTPYFVGNVIPSARINPIGQALMNLYPVVDNPAAIPSGLAYTGPTTGEKINTSGTDLLGDRADEFAAKLDHQFFPWWFANASYLHYGSKEPGGDPLHSIAGNQSPQASYLLYRKVDAVNQNNTFTVNPTTVVTVGFGFNRFPNNTVDLSNGYDITRLGFSSAFAGSLAKKAIPAVVMLNAATNGTNDSGPAVYYSRSAFASVAKVLGRHSLKAGYDYRTISVDFTDVSASNGQLYFDNSYSGMDLANLLLGYPTTSASSSTYFTIPSFLQLNVQYHGFYAQDAWRLRSNLTVNYGIRFEHEPGIYERHNHLVVGFNRTVSNPTSTYANAVGGVEYAGTNGYPSNCCTFAPVKVAPRIGVVYEIFPGTVVRGGYGLFFAPPYYSGSSSLAIGYTATSTYNYAAPSSTAGSAAPLSNLFPGGLTTPSGNSNGYATGVGGSITELDQYRRYPQVQQYSFDVQQQLPRGFVAKLGYVGAHGKNLQASTTSGTAGPNINQVPSQYWSQYTITQMGTACSALTITPPPQCNGVSSTTTLARALRPFQAFNTVTAVTDPSRSNYNSMNLRLEKPMSHGYMFLTTFTWSSAWDSIYGTSSTIDPGNTSAQDAFNINQGEYARSITDMPLRWTVAGTYELPFGKRRRWIHDRWLDLAVGGWNVNAVGVKQSGTPLALSMNSNGLSTVNAAAQRPNFAPGFNMYNVMKSGRAESRLGTNGLPGYLNSSVSVPAFTSPNGTYYAAGNVPRTISALSPGLNTWDLSIFKSFSVEGLQFQFRAEALNAFNTPQFAAPNVKVGSSSFGQVTSQVNLPRYIQLGGRVNF